CARDQSNHDYW
nr:immunoglobulin heavy chain junction region [Macaca mulatta]MOW98502.1 immunoglobulin heavy chain junction region [Macaca mulatta]MOW98664.1 immunoglobulin heavy chain junction region [Macaca mulatta]MOW98952.1 immunoglobulin heavy chain junction region [Macaca mulatta]MOX02421.1 immunoglobulin heavy chain junction region [Macaca mulatta]